VHTPGHSPGHAAYLHRPTGVLITGDSIFNVRGVRWPIKSFCTDFRLTQKTAHRLAELDYTTAAFTHGPEIRVSARDEIRRFLATHPVQS
jgi:glyoxylase-like metal-dependent hydrolase (beta-lactamase superfamily II)